MSTVINRTLPAVQGAVPMCIHGFRLESPCSTCVAEHAPAEAPNFQVGDVVRLKSGGPSLTVANVKDGKVALFWFLDSGVFQQVVGCPERAIEMLTWAEKG